MDRENILRYPKLDTILMVEDFLKEYSGKYSRKQVWESLPKRMMYQTFQVVLNYLSYSGKIKILANGKIKWIHNFDYHLR